MTTTTEPLDSITAIDAKPARVRDLCEGWVIATQGGALLRVTGSRLVVGVDGTYKVTLANTAGEEHVRTLSGDDIISTVLCDCGKGRFCPQYGDKFGSKPQAVTVTLKVFIDRDQLASEYSEPYSAKEARDYIEQDIRGAVEASFPFTSGIARFRDA